MRINLSKKNKGMTLIEVLLSIAIIGIIVATMIPIITSSFINVVNSSNRTQSMYDSTGKIEEAIAKRESIDLEGELLIFKSAMIPIKFDNIPVKYVSGGKVIKNQLATFITDVPILNFEPYFLYEGYLDGQNVITVKSSLVRFLASSVYKINNNSFTPLIDNDNQIRLTLPLDHKNAWKNEYNPYKLEIQTGTIAPINAKGVISILQPKAMVVGNNNINISSDFKNKFTYWRERNIGNNKGFNSVKYMDNSIGKGYVTVGSDGKIANLYDGLGWKYVQHNLTEEELTDIAFGIKDLVVVGENGTILHSSSKDVWNITNILDFNEDLMGVEYGLLGNNEYFVAVGENGSWLRWNTEEAWDLVDWNIEYPNKKGEIESQTFNDIQAISYKKENGKSTTMFVAVGTNGGILKNSPLIGDEEGQDWFYNEFTSNNLNAISFNKDENNPILIAVGDYGTILYSDNTDGDMGQNWETIGITDNVNFSDIQFFEGKFIAVGNDSTGDAILISSEDGKNWIPTTTNLGKMIINGISGY